MKENDEGLRDGARIIEVLDDHERKVASNPFLVEFKCLVGEEEFEEILSYMKSCTTLRRTIRMGRPSGNISKSQDTKDLCTQNTTRSRGVERRQMECQSRMREWRDQL